jgi:hypothetical protein
MIRSTRIWRPARRRCARASAGAAFLPPSSAACRVARGAEARAGRGRQNVVPRATKRPSHTPCPCVTVSHTHRPPLPLFARSGGGRVPACAVWTGCQVANCQVRGLDPALGSSSSFPRRLDIVEGRAFRFCSTDSPRNNLQPAW